MNLVDILFYIFAIVTLVSAGITVYSRNIIYSAFSLLFTFCGVAGIYVLLNADFIAVAQILIYVGGILMLLVFGVMLTHKVINVEIKTGILNIIPGSMITAIVGGTLCGIFMSTDWLIIEGVPPIKSTTNEIGTMFMTKYLLPFEIASVVLLVALIGAAYIARRDKTSKQSV
ncbi:MAG: NADH-quinone oxidoreductase subunit J [Ignavibacteriales bacterium]|nr:NADH-quinone oxidoreductase subunit J [Ignavibacteriales bacterium]